MPTDTEVKAPMRVAIITPYGAEERLDQFAEFVLAQGLHLHGDDVRYYTYRLRGDPAYGRDGIYKEIVTRRCPQRRGISPKLFWDIVRWRPQVVILFHIRSLLNLSAYAAARMVGAKVIFHAVGFLHDPYVVTDRDDPLETIRPEIRLTSSFVELLRDLFASRLFGRAWENYAYHLPLFRADARVTISAFEQEKLRSLAGLGATVIPNGIPVDRPPLETRPEGSLPARYLLFIGQVKARKGWDTAIDAVALAARQGDDHALVFVTSTGDEGVGRVRARAAEAGITDRLTLLRHVSNEERAWLYAHADATLCPSRYEGFGLPVVESWLAGTPVLGTDIPVYRDLLIDGKTGLISPKGDAEGLAQNILCLAEPGLRERLVVGGREKMHDYSDVDLVRRNLQLIRDVVAP